MNLGGAFWQDFAVKQRVAQKRSFEKEFSLDDLHFAQGVSQETAEKREVGLIPAPL